MLKEVRKIKSKQKQRRIRNLMERGVIAKHINEQGYLAYDTDEFEKMPEMRMGRPPKEQKSNEQMARETALVLIYTLMVREIQESGKPIDIETLNKIYDKLAEDEE